MTGVAALYPELSASGMTPLFWDTYDDPMEACLVPETLTLYAHLLNGCTMLSQPFTEGHAFSYPYPLLCDDSSLLNSFEERLKEELLNHYNCIP